MNFLVLKEKYFSILQPLAYKIWNENYSQMISKEQINYMLNWKYNTLTLQQNLKENHYWYLLLDKLTPVGFLHFFPKNNTMFLSKIYIDSASQGKGWAKKCINFIILKAKEENLTAIELTVNKNNLKAINTYKKFGFSKQKEVVFDIGNGFIMDDFIYEYNFNTD